MSVQKKKRCFTQRNEGDQVYIQTASLTLSACIKKIIIILLETSVRFTILWLGFATGCCGQNKYSIMLYERAHNLEFSTDKDMSFVKVVILILIPNIINLYWPITALQASQASQI